jgi:hypothetical protein
MCGRKGKGNLACLQKGLQIWLDTSVRSSYDVPGQFKRKSMKETSDVHHWGFVWNSRAPLQKSLCPIRVIHLNLSA